jgi:hypothetical protein
MIELLNSSQECEETLIDAMYDDDFYYGELNKLALSSSTVKLLNDSPKSYKNALRYGNAQTQGMRDGWLFHTAILEPEKFHQLHFVNVKSKLTKAYKEAKLEYGQVFTQKEREDAERLQDAFYRNEMALSMIQDSEFEVPMIGNVLGMPFRGKADILAGDRIVDLKTTTDIKNFDKSVEKYDYAGQVFIYCTLFNMSYECFKFVMIDKRTLTLGLAHCDKALYERGKASVQKAINTYKEYFVDERLTEDKLDNYYLEILLK